VAAVRARIEGFGMKLEGMALDVGSVLRDSLREPDKAVATVARLRPNILAAAEGGVPMLKYTVDMAVCIRAYRAVGSDGVLCPDHVPLSEVDPGRERFFAFCLGYTQGLLPTA
jgi:mannonate dehydratase